MKFRNSHYGFCPLPPRAIRMQGAVAPPFGGRMERSMKWVFGVQCSVFGKESHFPGKRYLSVLNTEHRTLNTWCRRGGVVRALLAAAALGLSAVVGWGETATVPSVTWTENLSGALARAGNELKPVLLIFSSPDCPWCMRLKSETLAEKEV